MSNMSRIVEIYAIELWSGEGYNTSGPYLSRKLAEAVYAKASGRKMLIKFTLDPEAEARTLTSGDIRVMIGGGEILART